MRWRLGRGGHTVVQRRRRVRVEAGASQSRLSFRRAFSLFEQIAERLFDELRRFRDAIGAAGDVTEVGLEDA
jgi:hypothetical protein